MIIMKKENQNLKGVVEDMNIKDSNSEDVLIRVKLIAENAKGKKLEPKNYDGKDKNTADDNNIINEGNKIVIKKERKRRKRKEEHIILGFH